MLVSELLALLPGPKALVGALLDSSADKPIQPLRVTSDESVDRLVQRFGHWHVVERPPLYQNPAARYCGWCKEALYTAYSPKDGLTPGWCPTHGKDALVLHATNPLTVDETFWLPLETKSKKYQVQTPKEMIEDMEYVRKKLFDALKVPKEHLEAKPPDVKSQTAHDTFLRSLGFESKTEFRRLAGINGSWT